MDAVEYRNKQQFESLWKAVKALADHEHKPKEHESEPIEPIVYRMELASPAGRNAYVLSVCVCRFCGCLYIPEVEG